MRLARAAAVLLTLAGAGAAKASSFDVSADPRFELLGVVAELSGKGRGDPADEAYRHAVERRFGALRGHAAVALYRELFEDPGAEEASAVLPMYYSPPPELALLDRDADIHYLGAPGRAEALDRLLWELRDFARRSDFAGFYREQAPEYAARRARALAQLGGLDPVARIERYTGLSLDTTAHLVLSPFAPVTHAFISPYPLPPANLGARRFEAYTVPVGGKLVSHVWSEPLYVLIDPSVYYFEKLNVPDPRAFYGPELAGCRGEEPNCVKACLVAALTERLEAAAGVTAPRRGGAVGAPPRCVSALVERLREYEADRVRYPTLWLFYPRLFSAFHELSHAGAPPARPPAVPAEPAVRSAADFFDPAVVARLAP